MADDVAREALDELIDGGARGVRGARDTAAKIAPTAFSRYDGVGHIAPKNRQRHFAASEGCEGSWSCVYGSALDLRPTAIPGREWTVPCGTYPVSRFAGEQAMGDLQSSHTLARTFGDSSHEPPVRVDELPDSLMSCDKASI